MAHLPLTPEHLLFSFINTTLTPTFIPTPINVLAIKSFYGLGGAGIACAFLYHPTDNTSGIVLDHFGRLAPVLEERWREFELAVAGAQAAMLDTWGVGGSWSRPQTHSCPTTYYYDLGPGLALAPAHPEAKSPSSFMRFTLTGHMVSTSRWWLGTLVGGVKWWKVTPEGAGVTTTVNVVPAPFLKVERIIESLRKELLPWDESVYRLKLLPEVREVLHAVAEMAGVRFR